MLFNHLESRKLGSTSGGNLQLFEDNIGLRAIATVTDEDVIKKAKNGELRGWSFSFADNHPNWQENDDGIYRRFLEDIDLFEVSILDKTPAYVATSIEARGEEHVIKENRGYENKMLTEDISTKEEQREEKQLDLSLFEKQIEILKLKGGHINAI